MQEATETKWKGRPLRPTNVLIALRSKDAGGYAHARRAPADWERYYELLPPLLVCLPINTGLFEELAESSRAQRRAPYPVPSKFVLSVFSPTAGLLSLKGQVAHLRRRWPLAFLSSRGWKVALYRRTKSMEVAARHRSAWSRTTPRGLPAVNGGLNPPLNGGCVFGERFLSTALAKSLAAELGASAAWRSKSLTPRRDDMLVAPIKRILAAV